jgi:predicted nuclease with TOPRIM domain
MKMEVNRKARTMANTLRAQLEDIINRLAEAQTFKAEVAQAQAEAKLEQTKLNELRKEKQSLTDELKELRTQVDYAKAHLNTVEQQALLLKHKLFHDIAA